MTQHAATVRATRSDGARSRNTILQAAARLATVEGLEGLSIGRLAEHIGMSKSGLYAHFGSKEELQLATIETAGQIFEAEVIQPTLGIAAPLDRLIGLCDAYLSHLDRGVFPGGCFFASVAAEFDMHPGAIKQRIAEFQRQWLQLMEDLARQAQDAGQIIEDEDPAQLVFEVDAFLLMANMTFLLQNDVAFLEQARRAIQARINRARAQPALHSV